MTEQHGSGSLPGGPEPAPAGVPEPTASQPPPESPTVIPPVEPPPVTASEEAPPVNPPAEVPPAGPPEAAPSDAAVVDAGTTPSEGQYEPGRGAPMVPGPPSSVSAPIDADKVNTVFGIAGVLMIVAVLIVVIVVGLIVISALRPR